MKTAPGIPGLPAALWLLPAAVVLAAAPAAGGRGELEDQIRARGLDPAEIARPILVTDGMKAWVRERVPRTAPGASRLKRLLEALKESSEPGFEYRAGYTGTVEEVFATGEYNCLSFSMLFVSLARELELPAYYLELKQDQDYDKEGDLIVVSRHLTAGYGFVRDRTILEFDLGPEINYQLAEPITDLEALALYYSNRGAELLRDGDVDAAAEALGTSLALAPDLAQAWVNLGVARRRLGDLEGAGEAYLRAIELERRSLPAHHNLLALERHRRRGDVARELIDTLDRRGNRNPFTFLILGDLSLEQLRLREAERFYRRALRLARHEAETHAAMGQWALAAGRGDHARSWLRRAEKIDAANERARRLRDLLAAGSSPAGAPAAAPEAGRPGLRLRTESPEGGTPDGPAAERPPTSPGAP